MFDSAVDMVIQLEGGAAVSNDPDDTGGLTKYGIAKASHPGVDIENLTLTQAKSIYRAEYWDVCRCGEMPSGVADMVFDTAVNMGPKAAIELLQASVGVHVDGIIGPLTLAETYRRRQIATLWEYAAQRMFRYGNTRGFNVFGNGWSHRLMTVLDAALTEAKISG